MIKILAFVIGYALIVIGSPANAQDIKNPNVAGMFYPDDPKELSQMIDTLLQAANPGPVNTQIFALIFPHAGYGYSGQTAAFGYKLIKARPYKTVIILAPSHHFSFNGASLYPKGIFRTPLGDLEIDEDFTEQLLSKKDEEVRFLAQAFEKEHSLEVQLPFLQKTLSGIKIVPILLGDCSLATCQKIAGFIKQAIGIRKDVLVVASTDMYHGYDFEEADEVDNLTLSYLKDMDAEGLYYGLREGKLQLCGGFGVVTTLILAKELGHNKLLTLNHTNSALVTGKKVKGIWTVGYTSCVIDGLTALTINPERSQRIDKEGETVMLNNQQRKRLLGIARQSIEEYLKTNKKPDISETDPVLNKEMGVFVTLHKHSELRGCIGNLIGRQPLYLTVRDMAVEAAVDDPRFPPLELSELKDIEIEISVLSPLERVDSAERIELGKHGVLIKKDFRSGVFLPQVAQETGWSREEFLSYLCAHKAGLPKDAWKDKSTEIYVFTAEVFSELNY